MARANAGRVKEITSTANAAPAKVVSDGGGRYPPGMEARIAALEAHMDHVREALRDIRGELRWHLMLLGAGFIGLAGIMAKGFGWLG